MSLLKNKYVFYLLLVLTVAITTLGVKSCLKEKPTIIAPSLID